jgi:phage-related holin
MKSTMLFILLSLTTTFTFLCSYFFNLSLDNSSQYLAVIGVAFLDGIFGIIAGVKREGFKTYKALKVLKSLFFWIILLTTILSIESAYIGAGWLSETVIIPFIVFQLISILKNASMLDLISNDVLKTILNKIDQHKNINPEN